jgi:GNAT superfamily N-acetyltransferase
MLTIRPATPDDVPEVLAMIRELAEYEKAPGEVVATEAQLREQGFGPRRAFEVLMADVDGVVEGFALFVFGFSTWRGTPTLHLEDLFVRPDHRKRGVGLALMRALAREARGRGCERFVWQVLDWNTPAIEFYESLGAGVLRQWLTVRVTGQALDRLAGGGRDAGA